jgi:methylamine dehydrogenase accessory protein MauD
MEKLWLASYILAYAWVIAAGLALFKVLDVLGRIHLRQRGPSKVLVTDDGPELHTVIPDVEGTDFIGTPFRIQDYRKREVVLLFLSEQCATSAKLLRDVEPALAGIRRTVEFVIFWERASEDAAAPSIRKNARIRGVLDEEGGLKKQLSILRTPYGLLIDRHGIVRMKGVVNDRDHLEALTRRQGHYVHGGPIWDSLDSPPAGKPAG